MGRKGLPQKLCEVPGTVVLSRGWGTEDPCDGLELAGLRSSSRTSVLRAVVGKAAGSSREQPCEQREEVGVLRAMGSLWKALSKQRTKAVFLKVT